MNEETQVDPKIEALEAKYNDTIKVLDEIDDSVKNFQIASILRNVVAMTIAPLQSTPEVLEVFMDLFELDMEQMGYNISKIDVTEKDKEEA